MVSLMKLKEALEREFAPPFVAGGLVKVWFAKNASKPTLAIKIGPRDIWLDEDGNVTGAGTEVGNEPL